MNQLWATKLCSNDHWFSIGLLKYIFNNFASPEIHRNGPLVSYVSW